MTTGMDRDPGDFPARKPPRPVADLSDDEFAAWLTAPPPPPGLRSIDDIDAAEEARALADVATGRCHDHAVVSRWLRTCGTADFNRFEDWLAEQDG